MKLDKHNWLILEELQKNARAPLTKIAKNVGMSSPGVHERIQKMEEAGIINGYHAKIDLTKIGYSLSVIISIKIRFGQAENFIKHIRTAPEIFECLKLTGQDCMQMKAHIRDTDHLEDLNGRLVKYGELNTSLVLSSIIKQRIHCNEF